MGRPSEAVDPAPLLEVQDLRTYLFTRWGVVKAVDGVGFSLHKGETLGIVGESGSGKSMTCLSLTRLTPAPAARIISGRILFRGVDLLSLPEPEMRRIRGRHIAMVLQDPMASLNPALTIGDQVAEPLRLHQKLSGPAVIQKSVEALKLVQISWPEIALSQYPHHMSGGMRQRVAAAIALACGPEVLIADEPTTSLDATIQAQFLALLKQVQAETGLAIIFVTHDFGIVAKMCDRVAVMYAGRIVESGPVGDIFYRPAHPYTEALLNSIPRLDQKVDRLPAIEGQPPALHALGPGCPFAPRCSYVQDRCWKQYPPQTQHAPGHVSNCWRWTDSASSSASVSGAASPPARLSILDGEVLRRNKIGPPLLEARDVGKYFPLLKGLLRRHAVGTVRAVDGVSFSVSRGSTLAVVGESGCGKTTLTRLILRLETPTFGQILFGGADVHRMNGEELGQYRRAVQAVFQDPWSSMNPRMRVGNFIAEPLVVNERVSTSERDRRVSEVLEQVGLRPEHAHLYPHEFSGGQRQRICIARALAVRPSLLVLDEAVSSLDVSVRAQILNLLKDLQAQHNLSYILVAHNLATVRFMSHQMIVMYLGKVVESGAAEAVFHRPLHPYTQALVAAALPSFPGQQREDVPLVGEVPSPLNVPAGCRLHTRCPRAMPVCAQVEPAFRQVEEDHQVACHLY